jgi:hypothetical protein
MNIELVTLLVLTGAWAITTVITASRLEKQSNQIKSLAKIVDAQMDLIGQTIGLLSLSEMSSKKKSKGGN